MIRAGWIGAAVALSLGACAPHAELPSRPTPYGAAIAIDASPVPLDPTAPARTAVGAFAYAGGIHLTSTDTARLHGLSDLKVWPDGRFIVQGDQADLIEGRLILDAEGRLVGVGEARLSALKDVDGAELYTKGQKAFDAEGIAQLANGDRLASFEQHDRILLYPRGGGLPVPAPMPQIVYVDNSGMEALASDPASGPDAYRVGIEETGEVFACRLSGTCVLAAKVEMEARAGLVAMEHLPGGRWAYLTRSFAAGRGNTVKLKVMDAAGMLIDEMTLARPLTVDNLEGLGAVAGADGRVRFYLVSDDNFGMYAGLPTDQRTLLLAFDWTPPAR